MVLPSVKDEWWNKVSLDDFSTKISGSIATVTKAFVFFWFFSWFLVSTISFYHSFSFLRARALAADAFVLSENPNARSWEANLVVWRLLWWLQSVEGDNCEYENEREKRGVPDGIVQTRIRDWCWESREGKRGSNCLRRNNCSRWELRVWYVYNPCSS